MYPLKHKSDVFAAFKQWKAMIEKQTGKKVKRLRTDNGMESVPRSLINSTKIKELYGIIQFGTHHNRMELQKG